MTHETRRNLEALKNNPYRGRGIVVGLDETGRFLVQIYWIMGRSANSRNRVFASDAGRLWTEAADPAKVADPSLIIYNAMRETKDLYVVTNGDQTDTIIEAALAGEDFRQALNTRVYEPDAPNFTPRISAVCSLSHGAPVAELAVLKKSPFGNGCDRHFFRYEQFSPGIGYCITTYLGDGNPLPSFRGEPLALPLEGDAQAIARTMWDALNAENRVSFAVKFIEIATGRSAIIVLNQYRKA